MENALPGRGLIIVYVIEADIENSCTESVLVLFFVGQSFTKLGYLLTIFICEWASMELIRCYTTVLKFRNILDVYGMTSRSLFFFFLLCLV